MTCCVNTVDVACMGTRCKSINDLTCGGSQIDHKMAFCNLFGIEIFILLLGRKILHAMKMCRTSTSSRYSCEKIKDKAVCLEQFIRKEFRALVFRYCDHIKSKKNDVMIACLILDFGNRSSTS